MKKKWNLRLISQLSFFLLVALIVLNHEISESGIVLPIIGSSSLHSICPFGGVAAFVALFRWDVMVPKIHLSSFVVLGIIFVMSIIAGPLVCSYMCPLGSIQEWFGGLGRKIFKKRYNHFVPLRLDKILRYLRYLVLIWVVYLTTMSLRLVFLEVDPYFALFNFWSSEATLGGLFVLGVTLLLSLFVERPWCKYACPFGALIGLTNLFSILSIRRNKTTCVDCKRCDTVCPMNIEVSKKKVVRDHQCIRCFACTSEVSCPVPQTVELKVKAYEEVHHEA